MRWISTTKEDFWKEMIVDSADMSDINKETLTGITGQIIKGFGGCFNELGAIALQKTDNDSRKIIFDQLFQSKEDGCNFNFCRVPIGASDFAAQWYSLDEFDEDYTMEHFSIDRDRKYLLPYIKEAMKRQKGMSLFASPWSPPSWMKTPKVYNFGHIRMEEKILKAYALYFKKFVEAYQQEGIRIEQVHIQNEVFADMKYPSCKWDSQQLQIFIRDYIGPLFKNENIDTQIWLGTLNGPEDFLYTPAGSYLENYNRYVDNILFDEETRQYISGISYQYSGRNVISRTYDSWPEIPLIQSENECGDGCNSWEYAEYVFGLMHRYFHEGVTAYMYWNMILESGGQSTWGWKQNSMITIEPDNGKVTFNPDFYAIKHFSAFVRPGAVLLKTKGHWNSVTTVFKNPDGTIVIIVQNALNKEMKFTFDANNECFTACLLPNSMNTFII